MPSSSTIVNRDVAAGAVFLGIGLAGLWIGRDLAFGTASEMGEGYFPLAMCGLLAVLGAAVTITGVLRGRPPLPRLTWRPLVAVTAAILAFTATLESSGVVVAVVVTVIVANFAGQPLRLLPLFALAIVLAIGVLAVFVWGLGMPIQTLPRWSS